MKLSDIPENFPEREKYYLYSEMIHQLQMARDHLLRQQSEKSVSFRQNFTSYLKIIDFSFSVAKNNFPTISIPLLQFFLFCE